MGSCTRHAIKDASNSMGSKKTHGFQSFFIVRTYRSPSRLFLSAKRTRTELLEKAPSNRSMYDSISQKHFRRLNQGRCVAHKNVRPTETQNGQRSEQFQRAVILIRLVNVRKIHTMRRKTNFSMLCFFARQSMAHLLAELDQRKSILHYPKGQQQRTNAFAQRSNFYERTNHAVNSDSTSCSQYRRFKRGSDEVRTRISRHEYLLNFTPLFISSAVEQPKLLLTSPVRRHPLSLSHSGSLTSLPIHFMQRLFQRLYILTWFASILLHAKPNVEDLVRPFGYPIEKHDVLTDDGVLLGVYRIPYGVSFSKQTFFQPRPVVYLQHGVLDSCASWIMNGPGLSLGFILADAGFDVWMGNSRGSTFSDFDIQPHLTKDVFWNFSLDELSQYDLPATFEYILTITGVEKMIYIGHSQGTELAFALFSMQHPITQHIAFAFMLSPVAFVKHITSLFMTSLATFRVDRLFDTFGIHKFMPTMNTLHIVLGPTCEITPICADILAVIFGYNIENMNTDYFDTYLTYVPAGTSVKLMEHWGQKVRMRDDRVFPKYDYGTNCRNWLLRPIPCNQNVYGQRKPPQYDLGKVQIPMMFFDGGRDTLADVKDVKHLREALPPGVIRKEHFLEEYAHLDFVWGIYTAESVYSVIVDAIHEMALNGTLQSMPTT